jgi:hypothetical protein
MWPFNRRRRKPTKAEFDAAMCELRDDMQRIVGDFVVDHLNAKGGEIAVNGRRFTVDDIPPERRRSRLVSNKAVPSGGKEHVLRYWPHGKPIPAGWVVVDTFADIHHGHHAVLIEKIDPEASDE